MNIIEPSAEIWIPNNMVSHVAKCARICYDSKNVDDERLYKVLINNRHWSMFRHETHYISIPKNSHLSDCVDTILTIHGSQPGFNYSIGPDGEIIIVVNGNWALDCCEIYERLKEYEMNIYEFEDRYLEFPRILDMMRYTFCITTQISTSRELNRVSPNNIAERSTRYVNESEGIICRPHWISKQNCEEYFKTHDTSKPYVKYLESCESSFQNYKDLLNSGISKENARGVLPLDTATKVVYTYDVHEWSHIIDLRYNGTTGKPHPNAHVVIGMVKNILNQRDIL